MTLNKVAKETREALERHRKAEAKLRRDGWHAWRAHQKQEHAGSRQIFAWLRRELGPEPAQQQSQLDEASAAWRQFGARSS